jgi:hypothetical protein
MEEQQVVPKFKIGDAVKVVKYGHLIWEPKDWEKSDNYPIVSEGDIWRCIDISPSEVGKLGIVNQVSMVQNIPTYSLSKPTGKLAWFDEGQLELIKKEENNDK